MSTGLDELVQFFGRLQRDPAYAERVARDPVGEFLAADMRVSAADLKLLLQIPAASDAELGMLIETYLRRVDEPLASQLIALAREYLHLDEEAAEWDAASAAPQADRPLGALPTATLSERQLRALTVLAEGDLAPVREYLVAGQSLPAPWIDAALYEFRRYLGLAVVLPGTILMPSPIVDKVWHASLLFTELYTDLCERAFGRFIHHDPWESEKPPAEVAMLWARFKRVYLSLYGAFGRVWGLSCPPDLLACAGEVVAEPASWPDNLAAEAEGSRAGSEPPVGFPPIASPPGVRADAPLSEAEVRRLTALERFDLTLVEQRVRHDQAIPEAWIAAAMLECRRYLGLRATLPEPVVLFSPHVDTVWHTLIMHTRLYDNLCRQVVERPLHHDPRTAHHALGQPAEGDALVQWQRFQGAYESVFGPLGPLWRLTWTQPPE